MGTVGAGGLRVRLSALFFLSGFAALIYQVCWQKQLNTLLGVDTLSVVLVVVVFMLGLGVGAVVGGQLADRTRHVLRLFVVIEVLIAAYGAASVSLIAAGAAWGVSGTLATVLAALCVLGAPTVLMGMTLPVLVIGLDRRVGNIGDATGTLYFVNTVGGASGAVASGLYLFHVLTIPQVVLVAVGANLLVAAGGAWMIARGEA